VSSPGDDAWRRLRRLTPARIGLGRSGDSLPTVALLDLQVAEARARDAVHRPLDLAVLLCSLPVADVVCVASRAADRRIYLQRPDLGRRVAPEDVARLPPRGEHDALFVIADGLSADAVHRHAAGLLGAVLTRLAGWRIAPVIVVTGGRVAIGDEIGEALGVPLVAVLIGERPGLSAADSLGVYLTWEPRLGRRDAERNCISNIRPPEGLGYEAAADMLHFLMAEARRRRLTGVALKGTLPALPCSPFSGRLWSAL
jgi:ethanolamine ammonia-lyase small subunit